MPQDNKLLRESVLTKFFCHYTASLEADDPIFAAGLKFILACIWVPIIAASTTKKFSYLLHIRDQK